MTTNERPKLRVIPPVINALKNSPIPKALGRGMRIKNNNLVT